MAAKRREDCKRTVLSPVPTASTTTRLIMASECSSTARGTFVGGIDGLYAVGGDLLAIQNGLRPHRVVRIVLADGARRVERVTVVASNLPELAEMTTAAVGGGEIRVLAASQLVQLVSSGSADD
jgi:hypothetical protein